MASTVPPPPPAELPTHSADGASSVAGLSAVRAKLEGTMMKTNLTLASVQAGDRWPDVLGHLSAVGSQLDDLLREVDSPDLPSLLVFPVKLCANPAVCT